MQADSQHTDTTMIWKLVMVTHVTITLFCFLPAKYLIADVAQIIPSYINLSF